MKKIILTILCIACFSFLFATVSPIVTFNPLFKVSTYPLFNIPESHMIVDKPESDWIESSQDVYYRFYNQIGLADLGLTISGDHFNAVIDMDIRQSFSSFCKKQCFSNIPFVGNDINAVLDMNFPRIAYGEVSIGNLYASIGRRPIGWGPAKHGMAISSDVPFLDNLWVEYSTDVKEQSNEGVLNYNFVAVSLNSEALKSKEEKTLLAHKLAWSNDFLRVSLGELNLIYGENPNLLDISPFGVYHNLFQDSKSNVMLSLSVEGLLRFDNQKKLRLYGSFAMDDFDLPGEREKNNGRPSAIGYNFGVQFHILDAKRTSVFDNSIYKYALNEDSFKFDGGLNLGYEFYFCSPYMYNRSVESGKFTVPSKLYGSPTSHDSDAMYLGYKFGPNSMYHELSASYSEEKISANLGIGLLVRGDSYNISSPYGVEAVNEGYVDYDYCFKLFGNKHTALIINAGAKWLYREKMELLADFNCTYDVTSKKAAINASLGTSIALQ